jgi:hypothetical protein
VGDGFGGPSTANVVNCTFGDNNQAPGGGALSVTQTSSVTVANCIFWGNSPAQIVTESGATLGLSYSDVQGGWSGGAAIMDANPLFTMIPCEYSLQSGSPCINQGNSAAVPAGITTDLCGNPRSAGVVDMGATEFQCYANCDGSTIAPVLNVNDFICFQNRFAAGDSYANCDGSTIAPVLNVNDFICFQTQFAAGCP